MRIKVKKSLGQNFLEDNKALSKIIETGNISKRDIILEIGPGTGNLTERLLNKNPKELYVVEKDKDLADMLKRKFGRNINIINDDILKCYNDFRFDRPIKVFGNLPYNISTKILTSFIKIENLNKFFEKFIFVFQKEVVDRIVAVENTKDYGRLSVITSWKMNKSKIINIPPNSFSPVPKVWSSLILLSPKSNFEKLKKDRNLEHITNIFFHQRRKMIKRPMKFLFKDYIDISNKLNIDLKLRPQNLSVKKYIEICKIYEDLNI